MSDAARRLAARFWPAAAIVAVQLVAFPMPPGLVLRGVLVGGLTALVAIGMALIYRSDRILNLAQADLGGPSAVLAIMLVTAWGWSWYVAVGAGLAAAAVLGAVVELAVIRRFRRAPRLLLTVATIGLSQLLAAGAILLPRAWGVNDFAARRAAPPFTVKLSIDPLNFTANDIVAAAVIPLAVAALWFFLQRTAVGTAVRASAEDRERAALLGVPVGRIGTVVWSVAGLLAFTATFLRAGILGLPVGLALSYGILLRSLAALMLGRLTDLPAVAASAVALGVLELGVAWNASSPLLIDPILAAVVVLALVARRRSASRSEAGESSSWQAAADVRAIPRELAALREVRVARWTFGVLAAVVVVALPTVLPVDRSLKASAVLIYGILGVSLVVLTGWSGQVSLGSVAFFAIGAAVGGKATSAWGLDLTLALVLAAAVGAAVSVVVGLPALRLRGIYLAVTTFAFALATTSYFLNDRFFGWLPTDRIERAPLLGRIGIESATAMYELSLAGLVLVIVSVRAIRRSRTGRVLIAIRENDPAAQSFGISVVRAKLTAFAVSGAIAAFAGALFVHQQQAFGQGPYEPGQNLAVFAMVVIGGITSVPGALLGALYLRGAQWFLPLDWQPLASGAGVLLALMILPGGLGGLLYSVRDAWLRWVARRHGVSAPALAGGHARPAGSRAIDAEGDGGGDGGASPARPPGSDPADGVVASAAAASAAAAADASSAAAFTSEAASAAAAALTSEAGTPASGAAASSATGDGRGAPGDPGEPALAADR
ncbi:MAG: ABC transporter permease [Actinobacteria bacterium]|nr:ABC transporter permease [Actinomycetota bacterium]